MAKIEFRGMARYLQMLEGLEVNTYKICAAATYAGAKVMADEIRKSIEKLERVTDAEAKAAWHEKRPVKICVSQKIGLLDALGVAPITNKYGIIGTKIGFSGYNDIKTERWPQGQPNQMVAGACESGSSAMQKQPFIRPTVNRTKKREIEAMDAAADMEIKKITGGNDT